MAVLENLSSKTAGIAVRTNRNTGAVSTVTGTRTETRFYREGTGRRRKPDVQDVTPYRRIITNYPGPLGTSEQVGPGHNWHILNPFVPFGAYLEPCKLYPYGDLGNLADIAGVQALSRLNLRDMDLGTAWAERGKTASLVADVAGIMVRSLNAIKRRDGRGLLNELGLDHSGARGKGVVDAWLAYQYGVKPLLQDVAGAAKALTRMPPESWSVRSSSQQKRVDSGAFTLTRVFDGWTFNYQREHTARVTFNAELRKLTRQQDMMWALGLDNPLATMWEVTPYSFMLDWLSPVGDWLSAMNAIKYYEKWQKTTTLRREESFSFSGASYNLAGVACKTTGRSELGRCFFLDRTVSSVPFVGLPVKNPASVGHMANALSLLASRTASAQFYDRIIRY